MIRFPERFHASVTPGAVELSARYALEAVRELADVVAARSFLPGPDVALSVEDAER